MKELLQIYTESKTLDNIEEIKKCVEDIQTKECGWNFEELARYCYQDDNGINTLVELQIPTKEGIESGMTGIEMVAYEYDGDIEDFMADREVMSKDFNGDWSAVIEQMKEMAMSE